MMQITFIAGTYRPDRCGVADYTAHLRRHLAQRQVQSTVLTTYEAAAAQTDQTVRGVTAAWGPRSLIHLTRALFATPTNILHIQHAAGTYQFQRSMFGLPLLLRSLGYQPPIVTTAHEYGWWEWQPNWIPAPWLERLKVWGQQRHWWDREDGFLLTGSEAIVITNDRIAKIMGERLPDLQDRITAIPIAANLEVVPVERSVARQELLRQTGWTEAAQVIVFFGFLHPVKGIETLLQAFRNIYFNYPQTRLLLIGGIETLALSGESAQRYEHRLQQQIVELHLENVVHRTGYVSAAAASRYLTAADLGVLPFHPGVTLKSGSLLALLAHRLPTIITCSAETDAVLQAEEVVARVPPRDVDSLTHQLRHLLSDAEQRHRLGQAGYQFGQQFTWDAIADRHLQIYNRFPELHSSDQNPGS